MIAPGTHLAMVLSLVVSATCSGLTAEPGVSREALADVLIKLTGERPTADLTVTLRADAGSLRDRTGASTYLIIHRPANAARAEPAPVDVQLRHPATGLPPPDSTGLNEAGELSFTPFTTCSASPCEESWELAIAWREPRGAAPLHLLIGVVVSVRYGEGTKLSSDDQISATIE